MSRHHIVHACGHEREHHLFGNRSHRTSKEKWLAEQDCWDCDRAEQNTASAARAVEADLPAFTSGSDKQIAWAVTIRDQILTDVDHRFSDTGPLRERVRAILLRETRAKRWIDLRNDGATGVLVSLCAPGEYRDLYASEDCS
ncbi:hypothetical protein ACL02S_22820 [Nocardia sp. 004]|uniref:hypothetical protein n=1 Tax=Nocardia sp. 004 TaxID=3385978 RepID=UPI0039A2D4FC